ncbi:hypothetical protein K503DRAFT_603518 [Rhizopogon vinicolor AM-OR11-026]|uniref:Uncharacterized protein n=1 Tax=Rhizopogon vinicolor AM-OR11-026 TaxID=1314800 RepID=A0A1B7MIP3_9AGAM|nr:hypothetical protein K503DRAFT_603518 [Rhizopogon vinicolor AM-OR11-026]
MVKGFRTYAAVEPKRRVSILRTLRHTLLIQSLHLLASSKIKQSNLPMNRLSFLLAGRKRTSRKWINCELNAKPFADRSLHLIASRESPVGGVSETQYRHKTFYLLLAFLSRLSPLCRTLERHPRHLRSLTLLARTLMDDQGPMKSMRSAVIHTKAFFPSLPSRIFHHHLISPPGVASGKYSAHK